jgi:hypothetical protein
LHGGREGGSIREDVDQGDVVYLLVCVMEGGRRENRCMYACRNGRYWSMYALYSSELRGH